MMAIKIEIKVIEDQETLIIDGHELVTQESIKHSHIVLWLDFLGYIKIDINECTTKNTRN
jgi:hypothetical protein